MTLPVSSYEELLVQVRELTHETILLQKQLSSDLFSNADPPDVNQNFPFGQKNYESEKHLTDNVIRQCIDAKKNNPGPNPLAGYNNLKFRPRFYQGVQPNEAIRSGELTSRVLGWQSRNQCQLLPEEDTGTSPKQRGERTTSEEKRESRRIGGEGVGQWLEERHPQSIRTHTSLSNTVAAHELESTVDGAAAFSSVLLAPASSARCTSLKKTALKTPCASSSTYLAVNVNHPRVYLAGAETSKENAMEPEVKEEDERRSSTPSPEVYVRKNKHYNEGGSSEEDGKSDSSVQSHRLPSAYRGTWPIRKDLWANQQMGFSTHQSTSVAPRNDVASVMSFSSGTTLGCVSELQGDRRLGAKMDVVYNLLGMLDSTEGREDMSATLLAMSNSIDSCLVMRQSGCLPLLVQLIHAPGQDPGTRERASRALHNVVHAKSDERAGRREARVLRFLEQLREYCQALRTSLETGQVPDDLERHPGPTIAALMKLSFDEAHRHAMCQLGGLHAVAELIEMDHLAHGSECDDQNCITLRRYAGMALTNLTFGDGNNKALLCSFREFMKALVSQLRSPSDDLRQVTASVLRNLSWRADTASKQTLREVGAVTGLMKAAMEGRKESTLKSILSALWNLSAHCSTNKVDICAVDGALAFLVDMLSYKAPSKTLAIVENAGGILRNVSSHIAVREDYRAIVREKGCLQVLLQQLRSPSLTVVSNACGALWNLSARCPQDQRLLWDLGAVPMLRSLVHSKHKMISMGSSAALKNLLSARPGSNNLVHLDSTARGLGLPTLPTLVARRQRALEQEIDQNLAETCDNIEPSTSPTNKDDKFSFKMDHSFLGLNPRTLRSYPLHNQPSTSTPKCNGNGVARSESRDSMRSITSTHSDTMFERVNRHVLNGMSPTDIQVKQQSSSLHSAIGFDHGMSSDSRGKGISSEKKYTLRYKNAIPDRLKPSDAYELSDVRCTNSTISWCSAPDQESTCSQMLLHSSEDNLSLENQSLSSLSKVASQSSVSEETEPTVCAAQEYQRNNVKQSLNVSGSFGYGNTASMKEAVNFSNMYSEKSVLQHDPLNTIQKVISPTVSNPGNNLFSDSVETDLDQPTDYSLRYAEQTSEDDENKHSAYFSTSEQELIHEDTIKTYCTEETPHETSLNSSRAPSASDLQEESRTRNSTKKLLGSSELGIKEPNTYEGSDTDKSSDFTETSRGFEDVNRGGKTHRVDRSLLSLRNTPTQAGSNLHYTEGDSVILSSAVLNLDAIEQSTKVEATNGLSKNLSANSSVALKASSDSGYQVSDGDEDDEDLLTACINIGMQNNRHRHSFIGNSFEKLPRTDSNLARYQTSVALDQMDSSMTDTAANNLGSNRVHCKDGPLVVNLQQGQTNSLSEYDNVMESVKNLAEHLTLKAEKVAVHEDQTIETSSAHVQKKDEEAHNSFASLSNLRSSPVGELHETMIFDTVSQQEEYNSSMETQSNEAASSLPQQDLMDEDKLLEDSPIKWPDNHTSAIMQNEIDQNSSKQTPYIKVAQSESSESIDSVERSEHALLELCIQPGIAKNIDDVSTKGSIPERCGVLDESAGKHGSYIGSASETYRDISEIDGIQTDERTKGIESNAADTNHQAKEEIYRRQRDPDAMIASLDRLTATLVQQTEAMRERESNAMKQSILSDTWNEDSPNEVSFPSISISAPLIASFKSDAPEEPVTIASEYTEVASHESTHMTNSKIIQREAIKLAEAVDAELNKHNEMETNCMTSMDLDAIKPPSSMGSLLSLTASYAGDVSETSTNRDRCNSTSLPPMQVKGMSSTDIPRSARKKSLPVGVVAKRALSQGHSSNGSLENLLNECTGSHLESVKPPSMIDDLPDVGDMENSMVSVASIMSEVVDPKEQDPQSLIGSDTVFDLLKPVANVLSITCMRYAEAMQGSANNSLSECLENINPPSLFNEVYEMDESTMEPGTETLCSDTLCIDVELKTEEATHVAAIDTIDENENDTDEGATPLSSEYCVSSSAESTPKKRLHKNLTPKQKRNLAKERYKTYTIAAEFVKKEEERRKQEGIKPEENKVPRGKCSPFSKLTPKQRRQEDRARFQTQVLDNPLSDIIMNQSNQPTGSDISQQHVVEKTDPQLSTKSSIPTFTKLPVSKALRKKRTDHKENRERYRTRTLNESEIMVNNGEYHTEMGDNITHGEKEEESAKFDETETLEQNYTTPLNASSEGNRSYILGKAYASKPSEFESERDLRIQFVNGVSKKLMDVCTKQPNEILNVDRDLEDQQAVLQAEDAKDQDQTGYVDRTASDSDDEFNNTVEQPQEAKRPRIIKPGMARDVSTDSNATDKSEPESPKAIRGRRKPLYSNPITRKPTPQSSPLKQINSSSGIPIGRSHTSPIVRATRATTLRQNNNSPNVSKEPSRTSPKMTPVGGDTEKRSRSLSTAAKRASVPQKGSSLTFTKSKNRHSTPPTYSTNYHAEKPAEISVKPLERQGTFTKDEPEVENAPVVSTGSLLKTKIAKPIRGVSSKVHPTAGKPKITVKPQVQSKITKANSSEKIQTLKGLPLLVAPKRTPAAKVTGTSKVPTPTQNDGGKTFRKIGPLGQRSNSNSSIISDASTTMQTRKLAKEATSKIASLWKKVEENKKQRLEKPDTRQWIPAGNGTSDVDAATTIHKPPAFRLFRSSTFEGVAQEDDENDTVYKLKSSRQMIVGVQSNRTKYRNSCDLSGINANEAPCKIPIKSNDPSTYKSDTVQSADGSAVMRRQHSAESSSSAEVDPTKRISRLGSFIRVDPANAEMHVNNSGLRTPASAIVPPFNYSPKQDLPTQESKLGSSENDGKFGVAEYHAEITTASARVTTV